jgi:hypothetical protein
MAFPTDQTVSRLGHINATGTGTRDLFLKLYAGEVLTAFEERNIFMELHRTRSISKGKSAQFPLVGTATAKYHTAGQLIEADAIKHAERTVTVDDLLISTQFIANIDEAMNHYDVRSTYSKEAGMALSNTADKNIAKIIAIAAGINDATEAAAYFGASFDDEVYTANITIGASAGDSLLGASIVTAIYAALEEFDKKDITGDKVCVLPPAQYYALLNTSSVTGASWLNKDVGGSGSVSAGVVPQIGGIKIMMSNHLPSTDESSTSLTPNPLFTSRAASYKANFTGLKGLIFSQDAAATVKLLDLGVESEYQIDRQGTLMVAKYAMGHNVLRPACAIQLLSA